jgi:hypothetical protein
VLHITIKIDRVSQTQLMNILLLRSFISIVYLRIPNLHIAFCMVASNRIYKLKSPKVRYVNKAPWQKYIQKMCLTYSTYL